MRASGARPAMAPATVAREGRANVASAPVRSAMVALVAAVVGFAVVGFTVADVAGIAGRYGDQVGAGRFVLVARSADPAGLDVQRCDALNGVPGVRSAGAVLGGRSVFPATAPARPYEVLSITEGLIRAWFPGSALEGSQRGWLAGSDAAGELGLTDRSSISVADEARPHPASPKSQVVPVAQVLPASPRREEANRNLFEVVAPVGRSSTCHIDADPAAFEAIDHVASIWFSADQHVGVTSFLEGRSDARPPEEELASRPSAWGWTAGAGVVAMVGGFSWYGRRDEFALYRLLGASHVVVALLAVEAILTILVPAVVGVAVAVVVHHGSLITLTAPELTGSTAGRLVSLDLVALLLALTPTPLLGLVAVSRRSLFDQLKGL